MNRTTNLWVAALFLAVLGLLPARTQASLVELKSVPSAGEGGYGSAAIDIANGQGFFGSSTTLTFLAISSASEISEFNLANSIFSSTFSYEGTALSFNNFETLSAAAFDPTTGFGYFASTASPAGIEKIPLTFQAQTTSMASSATLLSGQNDVATEVLDTTNQFGYFGTNTSPSIVVKVKLSNLTVVSSIVLPAGLDFLSASVIDQQNGFAYFGSSTTPGAVAKIRLSDFTLQSTLTFNAGEGGVGSAVIDTANQVAYFGTHDSPGKVIEVQLSNLTRVRALTLPSGQGDLTSAIVDPTGGVAYFGTNTSSGIVVAVQLSNLSELTSLTLGAGDNFLTSAVIDTTNEYGYFGTFTTPGRVIQVDLEAGAPILLSQPASATAHPGDTVTFSVTALGRGLSYQWEMNGVAIAGATSASYSRTALITDDGSSFSCLVTGTNGSVTSASAQLTILPVINVFPNPWRSDRHVGIPITFQGLLSNSTTKIFNLAAHWVKTLPTAGGSVTWDLTNDAGEHVASGYYFYVITTGNSKQTVTGKLAVIH